MGLVGMGVIYWFGDCGCVDLNFITVQSSEDHFLVEAHSLGL